MDIKLARNITRKFVRNSVEYSPVLASDWKISQVDDSIFIYSEDLDISFYLSSTKIFVSNYVLNKEFKIENDNIIGNYYYTPLGLVNEQEYFLAEDIIEQNNNRIGKKDLKETFIYLSDKGEEVVYIGSLNIKNILLSGKSVKKDSFKTSALFVYNIEQEKLILLSSIKLIQDTNKKYSGDVNIDDKYFLNYINIDNIIYTRIFLDLDGITSDRYMIKGHIQLFNLYEENMMNFINSDLAEEKINKIKERAERTLDRVNIDAITTTVFANKYLPNILTYRTEFKEALIKFYIDNEEDINKNTEIKEYFISNFDDILYSMDFNHFSTESFNRYFFYALFYYMLNTKKENLIYFGKNLPKKYRTFISIPPYKRYESENEKYFVLLNNFNRAFTEISREREINS